MDTPKVTPIPELLALAKEFQPTKEEAIAFKQRLITVHKPQHDPNPDTWLDRRYTI